MAANIVCYYNFAHKPGILMLPVVINKIGEKIHKLADCHSPMHSTQISYTASLCILMMKDTCIQCTLKGMVRSWMFVWLESFKLSCAKLTAYTNILLLGNVLLVLGYIISVCVHYITLKTENAKS